MGYRLFKPPEIKHSDTAVVMGTGIGGFYGYPCKPNEHGNVEGETDATRRAKLLAERLGTLVLGYDGPGRGQEPAPRDLRSYLRLDFVTALQEFGTFLGTVLDNVGVGRIVVADHSLSALTGAALARSGALETSYRAVHHVVSIEPPLRSTRMLPGLWALACYNLLTERMVAKQPMPEGERGHLQHPSPRRWIKDISAYGPVSCDGTYMDLMKSLHRRNAGVSATLVLAQYGHTWGNNQEGHAEQFRELFGSNSVVIKPDVTHSHFDRSDALASAIEPALLAAAA